MKWAAAGLCGFEVAAILTGRAPTLTQLCARHRWLGPALVLSLAVHLYRQPRAAAGPECRLCPGPECRLCPGPEAPDG